MGSNAVLTPAISAGIISNNAAVIKKGHVSRNVEGKPAAMNRHKRLNDNGSPRYNTAWARATS
jgi:hypothetical protein